MIEMTSKKLLCVLAVFTCTACTYNNTTEQTVNHLPKQTLTAHMVKQPQGENATPDEIAECQKLGGSISKQGMFAHDFCVIEFADKGKMCTDGSECQAGSCIAENNSSDDKIGTRTKGVCAANNIPFGCYGTVNKGKFAGFLCVD